MMLKERMRWKLCKIPIIRDTDPNSRISLGEKSQIPLALLHSHMNKLIQY